VSGEVTLLLGSWIVRLLGRKLQGNLTAREALRIPATLMLSPRHTHNLQIPLLDNSDVVRDVSGDYVGQRIYGDGISTGDTFPLPSFTR
jgi:hypothetical protein